MAAGTVTTTEERLANVSKITFAWTAGTGGDAGTASGQTTYPYSGVLLRVVTFPGTGGTQPTDNYDLTLTDEDGVDVAAGLLANRDDTNAEWVTSGLGAVVGDKLTINVTNAGSGKAGTCEVYIGVTPETASPTLAIEHALYGTNGVVAFPAAAAAANGVSLAEVLRYVQESQVGSLTNSGGTATLAGILGDVANSSVAARLTTIAGYAVAMERAVEKSDGSVPLGADNLFTITGGPILVTDFIGIVTTEIGADVSTCQIQITTTAPAGTVNLSTAVNIETDAVGTSYTFTVATPGVLTPNTAGAIDQVPRLAWLCPIGTIKATFSAATTGVIKWYMVYRPLSGASSVAAAA